MATLGNLGAVNSNLTAKPRSTEQELPIKVRQTPVKQAGTHAAQPGGKVKRQEEALQNRDSSTGRDKAIEQIRERLKPKTLEELAELLRKVNLTFDLFEIQTRYQVNLETGEVTLQIVNQRTGEVIRKIPPYDVPKVAEALKNGDPLLKDIMV